MRDQKPRGVPMDEWLLAIGLPEICFCQIGHTFGAGLIASSIDAGPSTAAGSDWSAAWNGADSVVTPQVDCLGDEDNPDAYAAGAALAMALESDS